MMAGIGNIKKQFSADFAAARELVMEMYGRDWLKVVKAYRKERDCPLDQALFDLVDGAVVKGTI